MRQQRTHEVRQMVAYPDNDLRRSSEGGHKALSDSYWLDDIDSWQQCRLVEMDAARSSRAGYPLEWLEPMLGTAVRRSAIAWATAARSTPVAMPSPSSSVRSFSVARFPGAPGAKGQPPSPPAAESKTSMP